MGEEIERKFRARFTDCALDQESVARQIALTKAADEATRIPDPKPFSGRPSFSLPLLLWLPNCVVLTENPESLDACLERLEEMENDGLVRSDDGEITVTEEGKPFVRNTCMGFDVRLWQDKPMTQLFSMTI